MFHISAWPFVGSFVQSTKCYFSISLDRFSFFFSLLPSAYSIFPFILDFAASFLSRYRPLFFFLILRPTTVSPTLLTLRPAERKSPSSELWSGNEIAGSGSPKSPSAPRYPLVASRRLPVGVTQSSSWQPQWTLETPCWEATRPLTRTALSITTAPLARAATTARNTARPIPRHL